VSTSAFWDLCRRLIFAASDDGFIQSRKRRTVYLVAADDAIAFVELARLARGSSAGDRAQMTAPHCTRDVANRELGTIERIGSKGAWKFDGILVERPHSRLANAAISITATP
jgi:hypothetical protein